MSPFSGALLGLPVPFPGDCLAEAQQPPGQPQHAGGGAQRFLTKAGPGPVCVLILPDPYPAGGTEMGQRSPAQ